MEYTIENINSEEAVLHIFSKQIKILSTGDILQQNGTVYRGNNNGKGYMSIHMTQGAEYRKRLYIHRLVAQAFIPNPNNLPQVNHLDGNKSNNNANNLEWTNQLENNRHAHRIGLCVEKRKKPVIQMTTVGEIVKVWDTPKTAATVYGCTEELIQQAASVNNRNCLSAKEHLWIYEKDYENGNTDKLNMCIEKYKYGYYTGNINPQEKAKILSRYREINKRGSIIQIAKEYNRNRKTIEKIIQENNS